MLRNRIASELKTGVAFYFTAFILLSICLSAGFFCVGMMDGGQSGIKFIANAVLSGDVRFSWENFGFAMAINAFIIASILLINAHRLFCLWTGLALSVYTIFIGITWKLLIDASGVMGFFIGLMCVFLPATLYTCCYLKLIRVSVINKADKAPALAAWVLFSLSGTLMQWAFSSIFFAFI